MSVCTAHKIMAVATKEPAPVYTPVLCFTLWWASSSLATGGKRPPEFWKGGFRLCHIHFSHALFFCNNAESAEFLSMPNAVAIASLQVAPELQQIVMKQRKFGK